MQVRTVFIFKAIVSLLFGALLLALPEATTAMFGVTLTAGGVLAARLYGASALGHACVTWYARNAGPSDARRAIILGGFVYDAIGFLLGLAAVLAGLTNPLGWLAVLLYLLLAVGFGYFFFR